MTKENSKSVQPLDAVQSVASFLSTSWKEEILDLPNRFNEVFHASLLTHEASSIEYRDRALLALHRLTQLCNTIQPFSEEEIKHSCEKVLAYDGDR